MKYDVKHDCGHVETHALFGPGKERDRKLEWLKTTLCSECYKGQIAADREAASKLNASANAESGLPTLEGSEKQIAWAETIRATWKREADEIIATVIKGRETVETDEDREKCDAIISDVKGVLRQTSTKYWIDNRNEGARARLRRLQDKRIADAALGLTK